MKHKLLAALCLVAIALVAWKLLPIQSVEDYRAQTSSQSQSSAQTVTIGIDCSSVLSHWDQLDPALQRGDYIPTDGLMLPETTVPLQTGDTVYDVLERVCRQQEIPLEAQSTNSLGTQYVEGIGYLYEFSCGNQSGWVYSVNGTRTDVSCGQYALHDGDEILWEYTCSLGEWDAT